jgi:hypothetical protein
VALCGQHSQQAVATLITVIAGDVFRMLHSGNRGRQLYLGLEYLRLLACLMGVHSMDYTKGFSPLSGDCSSLLSHNCGGSHHSSTPRPRKG